MNHCIRKSGGPVSGSGQLICCTVPVSDCDEDTTTPIILAVVLISSNSREQCVMLNFPRTTRTTTNAKCYTTTTNVSYVLDLSCIHCAPHKN